MFTMNVYDVLVNEIILESVLHNSIMSRLDLIPATTGLSGAEVDLVNMNDREKKLKLTLKKFHGMLYICVCMDILCYRQAPSIFLLGCLQ
ncbi:MAG: AAA family ATPase [Endomicrobium sp.]|nr:AAA family ATPase [Endomicrobium sp.]